METGLRFLTQAVGSVVAGGNFKVEPVHLAGVVLTLDA